jgi:glycosyltransferase involved in cell wall biosynthesis
MNQPTKISVVTPSLNQGKFVEETILSVLNQDYPNIEYMIMDGGSTDNTLDIIKKYEDRIDYWVSEPDKGQSEAINKGFEIVTGDIVTWINSDDQYFTEDIFQKVFELFSTNPEIGACYGNNVYIDENSSILYFRKGIPFYSRGLLNVWNYIHQPTVFLRREVIDEFLLNLDFNYVMDYEYWLRIAQKHKFKYIDLLISASRWHNECKTMENDNLFFFELKKIHNATAKRFINRIIPPKYFFKMFYNIQRLYSLPFLWQLHRKKSSLNIKGKSWINLIKRQVFGLRFG